MKSNLEQDKNELSIFKCQSNPIKISKKLAKGLAKGYFQ